MPKNNSTIDGFIPRRRGGDNAATSMYGLQPHGAKGDAAHITLAPHDAVNPTEQSAGNTGLSAQSRESSGLSRQDIDQSLGTIDTEEVTPKRATRARKQPHKKRRIVRWAVIAVLVIVLGIGGFLGIKAILASSKIFNGNIFGIFQHQPLKQDANGRTNILVFGTSEDDPGHEAGWLTDSIMVVSLDQTKKNAFTMSIPRDFMVNYGRACVSGYRERINALYGCYSDNGDNEKAGAEALQKKVGEILGLDVQYYAHVNYTVVRDVVNAIGPITVAIESRDPNGQMDSNFDWKCLGGKKWASKATMIKNCPPNGHYIDYPNGPVTLDAEHALYLAQARGDASPTYGFEQSNFDREKNQQKILKAIREKALSAGTLTNLGKITGLLDALGSNFHTSFDTSEIQTLMDIAKDTPSDKIVSIPFIDDEHNIHLITSSGFDPTAGPDDYSEIQAYVKKQLSSEPFVREQASIGVYNGSSESGVAQKEADKLEDKGFTIDIVGNAVDDITSKYQIYDLSGGKKPATISKLESLYKVKAITSSKPNFTTDGLDVVVIVGPSEQTSSSSN